MPKKPKSPIPIEQIDGMIRTIRGTRVMLDRDLAKIYGVPTKAFNQAVKRNRQRFPEDFMFRLSPEEAKALQASRAQIVTLKRGQNVKYLPYAFTEYGALMAANILNSARAVQMSIFVVRAFAKMREALRGTPELERKLAALEKKLTARLDVHEAAIVQVLREVMQILNPPPPLPEPPRRRIGFHERPHTGGQAVGSPTHEKAITDALNAIDWVQEMSIENGAIHVP
jgi:phage regulator Rha-like protein